MTIRLEQTTFLRRSWLLAVILTLTLPQNAPRAGTVNGAPWSRHAIDASFQGADGTRLADVNGDGHMDIATGWEESGQICVYINPGPEKVAEIWPKVMIGSVRSPEDAVLVDLDNDGALDVVSSCEGRMRTVFIHFAPSDPKEILDRSAWLTAILPASDNQRQWMFCLPVQFDGVRGVDLVMGSKNEGGVVGWFESPEDPRDFAAWKWHALHKAGWIMSIVPVDMDGDGDDDILISDRRGESRGCFWLERPDKPSADWPRHSIGGADREVMFLTADETDTGGVTTVFAAVRDTCLLRLDRDTPQSDVWTESAIPFPEQTGTGKAVGADDVDLDGTDDLVLSCENSEGKHGVFWLSGNVVDGATYSEAHAISGLEGTKFDLVVLYDMDADGDLDALTCEERENLGVIWYENPAR